MRINRMSPRSFAGLTLLAAGVGAIVVASAVAATVKGTARNDTLRGTAKADKLYGLAGNDRLYGLAGNDYLTGGPGNDTITGGPGADTIVCGPGRDLAAADATDKIAADCETVQGVPKPAASVAGGSLAEGNSGTQPMNLTVTLAKASPLKVTLAYKTTDGTATAGSDYTATAGSLTFAPGETSKTVAVPIVGDNTVEPDETFTLTLSSPVNATLGTASATGTITNDDIPNAKPGHYSGPISSGGAVSFDVGSDSSTLTNLVIVFTANCQPSASLTSGVTFSGTATIQPDGTFSANGSSETTTVTFGGKFTNNGTVATASGSIQIHVSTDYEGNHYECDTGNSTWTATWGS
jgi:hypothetical protein